MADIPEDADIVDLLRGLVYGEHVNCKAADVIDYLREQLRFAERNWRECRQEIARLEEQLAIKETALKDTEEFRTRERKHSEALMCGMRLAIEAMASGMKGGK
jgi:flagellar motility protein MotE (MotC chaperone)